MARLKNILEKAEASTRLGLFRSVLGIGLLCGCASSDPYGLSRVESAFRMNVPQSPQKEKADELIILARNGKYFSAVSGLQTLRLNPGLTVDQLTAIQDAIGKIQSRLAEQAAQGDTNALWHIQALQSETEPLNEAQVRPVQRLPR